MPEPMHTLHAVQGGEAVEIVLTPAQVERIMIACERGHLPDPEYVLGDSELVVDKEREDEDDAA